MAKCRCRLKSPKSSIHALFLFFRKTVTLLFVAFCGESLRFTFFFFLFFFSISVLQFKQELFYLNLGCR